MNENIIYANFTPDKRTIITEYRYQYDFGQELVITGFDLSLGFEAHFCNDGDTKTSIQQGQNNRVVIPDEYFRVGKKIICFIYLRNQAISGETLCEIIIPIISRQEPVEPTPEEPESEIVEPPITTGDNE